MTGVGEVQLTPAAWAREAERLSGMIRRAEAAPQEWGSPKALRLARSRALEMCGRVGR